MWQLSAGQPPAAGASAPPFASHDNDDDPEATARESAGGLAEALRAPLLRPNPRRARRERCAQTQIPARHRLNIGVEPLPACADWAGVLPGLRRSGRASPASDDARRASLTRILGRAVAEGPTMTLVVAPSGLIEFANPALCRCAGYRPADLVGRPVTTLLAGGARRALARLRRALRADRSWSGVLDGARRDGVRFPAGARVALVETGDGRGPRVVAFVEDVTDRFTAEALVRQHHQSVRLHLNSAAMSHMAAALAHELNQPISAVVNYCNGVIRRAETGALTQESLGEAIRGALEEAARARVVLRRASRFVRAEPRPPEAHDLNQMLRAIARMTSRDVEETGAQLTLDLAQRLPAALVNVVEIEQVLLNLVHNSLEALRRSDATGPRRLTLRSHWLDPSSIRLTVEDSGCGFSRDELAHAFDPFYTTKPLGMGMGLAICYNVLEAHGGRIWAESEPGRGARIHFVLPAVHARPTAFATAARRRASGTVGGEAPCSESMTPASRSFTSSTITTACGSRFAT